MKIEPINDNVLVQPNDAEKKTAAGIIIPDNAVDKVTQGKVLAVGTGVVLKDGSVRPIAVQVGKEVLYGKYAGTELEINGKKVLMLKEEDILGVVVEK